MKKTIRFSFLTLAITLLLAACSDPEAPTVLDGSEDIEVQARSYTCPVKGGFSEGFDSFGHYRAVDGGPPRLHRGVDLAFNEGADTVAVVSGVARTLANKAVLLAGNDGYYYYYGHHRKSVITSRKPGQRVGQGQKLGEVGRTGTEYAHLHFERRNGRAPEKAFDPYPFLLRACAGKSRTVFDDRTFVKLGNVQVEAIGAYGRYWNFDGSRIWRGGRGLRLDLVNKYKKPCAGASPGRCRFDTRTFFDSAYGKVESITVGNQMWNIVGSSVVPQGELSRKHYKSGPCKNLQPDHCAFDTRTFTPAEAFGRQIESISFRGNYYNYDLSGRLLKTGTLKSVDRYRTGPCSLAKTSLCRFETRTFAKIGSVWVESITAYGHYWNYRVSDNSPWPNANSYYGSNSRPKKYSGIRPL